MSAEEIHIESIKRFNNIPWQIAVPTLWPGQFPVGFAEPHTRYWNWVDSIYLGDPLYPFFAIWSRNMGKSTNAEISVAYLMLLMRRKYCWYVSESQDSADSHVASILNSLNAPHILEWFPLLNDTKVQKTGQLNVWRRNRLKSIGAGFTIDAVGLNSKVRGRRDDETRPDIIFFDDIDGRHDSLAVTKKKIEMISDTIIPSGSTDVVYVGIQNLLSATGFFSRISNGEIELPSAHVDGPVPAIEDLALDGNQIVGGTAVWPERLSIEFCQNFINTTPNGLRAFLREFQHDVENSEGALWTRETIRHTPEVNGVYWRPDQFDYVIIGIDPAVQANEWNDETGIIVFGVVGSMGYVLEDLSGHHTANEMAKLACDAASKWGGEILYEANQGGMYIKATIQNYKADAPVISRTATVSKKERARPAAQLYEQMRVYHCGVFEDLEMEMISWNGTGRSPNRIDALAWAAAMLTEQSSGQDYSIANAIGIQPPPPEGAEEPAEVAYGLRNML